MIIVEGLDNTGKSTLVQNLMKDIPELIFGGHSGGPQPQRELMGKMMDVLALPRQKSIPVILDRFPYFSEEVYGRVLRGKNVISSKNRREVLSRIKYHMPLVIYCYTSISDIEKTFNDRKQMEGVKEHLEELATAYRELWRSLRGSIVYMSYNYMEDPEPTEFVRNYMKELRRWN